MAHGQEEPLLLDSVTRFLDEQCPLPVIRKLAGQHLADEGSDGAEAVLASLWRQLCELGWPLLLTREEQGGIDMGMAQAVQVMEAAGRALLPLPLAGWMTAYAFLQETAPESEVADWARACMRQGRRLVLGARSATGERYFVPYCDGRVRSEPQERLNTLTLDYVGDAIEMRVVPAPAGSARLDPVVRCAWLSEPMPLLAADASCSPAVWQVFRDRQRLLLVAELLGVAAGALQSVTTYTREREQFGRPIGAFQAIKHRLAQDWMNLDNVRLLVSDAAMMLDAGAADAALSLTLAESLVQDAAGLATRNALQFHGALGMTWECDMHFYLKRALLLTAQMNQHGSQARRLAQVWQMTESNVTVAAAHSA